MLSKTGPLHLSYWTQMREFMWSSFSKTPLLLRRVCPCFPYHYMDFGSPCSSLFWFLIIVWGHLNEVPAWLDSISPVLLVGKEELSVWKTLPIWNTLIPHLQNFPCYQTLPDCFLSFSLYLPLLSHVKKKKDPDVLLLAKPNIWEQKLKLLSIAWPITFFCFRNKTNSF